MFKMQLIFASLFTLCLLSAPSEGQLGSNSGGGGQAQCPWGRDGRYLELQASCLCSVNPDQALSVQCQFVNFTGKDKIRSKRPAYGVGDMMMSRSTDGVASSSSSS